MHKIALYTCNQKYEEKKSDVSSPYFNRAFWAKLFPGGGGGHQKHLISDIFDLKSMFSSKYKWSSYDHDI